MVDAAGLPGINLLVSPDSQGEAMWRCEVLLEGFDPAHIFWVVCEYQGMKLLEKILGASVLGVADWDTG